jgi:GNAT superfamily N-acetyltransferase
VVLLPRPRPGIGLREFEPADEPAVQEMFAAAADYFTAATGGPPAPGDVQSLFYALPADADLGPDAKRVLVIERDGRPVGVVDLVLGHPTAAGCAVGLFLLHPDHRRQRIGADVARALIAHAGRSGITLVTATTPVDWPPGAAFLEHLGFAVEPAEQARHQRGNRNLGPAERPVRRARLQLPGGRAS